MQSKRINAAAILLGFALVAGAIYFSGPQTATPVVSAEDDLLAVKRSADTAWTYGNKSAATTIVEFSDFECPFCAQVHPTLKKIVDESAGTIAWQYRHLPLPSHSNAETAAVMSECVGRLAGNETFWQFTDQLFANQNQLNQAYLKQAALATGLTEQELDDCINDSAVSEQISLDLKTARALGGSGTPFSVIVTSAGEIIPVRGALSYENWVNLLNYNE